MRDIQSNLPETSETESVIPRHPYWYCILLFPRTMYRHFQSLHRYIHWDDALFLAFRVSFQYLRWHRIFENDEKMIDDHD